MGYPLAPERRAEVIPQAQLIVLLRGPADRAYSDYQQVARKERKNRSFEETMKAEKTLPLSEKTSARRSKRIGSTSRARRAACTCPRAST